MAEQIQQRGGGWWEGGGEDLAEVSWQEGQRGEGRRKNRERRGAGM